SLFPYTAPYSIADSPSGSYSNNANNSITLTESVSLAHASVAVLNFYARWRIEAGYDYVQVKISTNNGSTWIPLEGRYTHLGNYNQAAGQPLYDGIVSGWVREEINLSKYAGQDIKLRFTLRSDGNTTDDGYFFDNLAITIIDVTTSTQSPGIAENEFMSDAWPNPATEAVRISYALPEFNKESALIISDLSGKVMLTLPVTSKKGDIEVNTAVLAPGLYLYSLVQNGNKRFTKKLIIQ
ncbi:MAG: T9SS type A sorting domain-containing protein, partial [Lentimicrobium sp.]|nr:T9SS type A sorting domain-containing protein [Lentimicrobium sp.]